MMFLILGFLDLFFAVMMLLMHFDIFSSWRVALIGAVFWIGKGILFRGSFLSALDFLAGIYLVLVFLGLSTPIVYLFLGVMVYKFTVSLVLRG